MYSKERIDLCQYRLSKAREYRQDAEKALSLNMYDTAANRSYYAIFHAVRALLALSGKDFRKHSGVISCFQMDYIKTGIFDKKLSNIIKSAFSLRTESDYEDFYVVSHEEVRQQVLEAGLFLTTVSRYIEEQISDGDRE
ncbi:MAG: HEPN domain-containing protein [Candidatus Avoscillospira sp.]